MHPPPPHATASRRKAEEILGLEEDEDVFIQNVFSEGHLPPQNGLGPVDFGKDPAVDAPQRPAARNDMSSSGGQ
jgi:hypothetical protein